MFKMSNASGNQFGFEKPKLTHGTASFECINSIATPIKRSTVDSSNEEDNGKKMRLDNKPSVENSNLLTLNSAAPAAGKDDLIAIRNFGCSNNFNDIASSPLQSADLNDEYVLFASDVMDYVDNSDYSSVPVTNTNTSSTTSIPPTFQSSLKLSTTISPTPCIKTTTAIKNAGNQTAVTSLESSSTKSLISPKDFIFDSTTTNADVQCIKSTNVATSESVMNSTDTDVLLHLPSTVAASAEHKMISTLATSITKSPPTMNSVTRVQTLTSTSVVRKNTVTYSRMSAAGTPNPASAALMNRVNIHSTLKNQPLIMPTKKLMSEVTQTTAKVSIGNTTISVPLLKPLNSAQLIQSSGEVQKLQQHPNPGTTTTQQATTTQLNLSKILNVKRSGGSQKVTHQPTIVSLSQLQIKPVSVNTKIVQAKMVNKKMALQLPAILSSTASQMQSTTAVTITATASKSKQNLLQNFTNQPKLYSQLTVLQQESVLPKHALPLSILQEKTISSASEDSVNSTVNSMSSDNFEHSLAVLTSEIDRNKWLSGTSTLLQQRPEIKTARTITDEQSTSASVQIKGIAISADEDAKIRNYTLSSANNTAMMGSMPPPPPLLTPISKHVDEQQQELQQQHQQLKMCSTVNIIKQQSNLPTGSQLLSTTTTTGTTKTLSDTENKVGTSAFESKILQTGSTGITGMPGKHGNNTNVSKLNNTPLIAIPKNISLLLARSSSNQQQQLTKTKTTTTIASMPLHTTTTAGVAATASQQMPTDHLPKTISVSMSSALNITAVNMTPAAPVITSLESSSSSSSHKNPLPESIISTASSVEPILDSSGSVSGSLEKVSTYTHPRKTTLKIASSMVVTALGGLPHQLIQRSKSTDETVERNGVGKECNFSIVTPTINSKRQSLEIHSNRRSVGAGGVTSTETYSVSSTADTKLANSEDKPALELGDCNSNQITPQETTHNVLLKQLLQNTSSSNLNVPLTTSPAIAAESAPVTTSTSATILISSASTMCTHALSARKVINVRAPSLGLVSSLEAQLARPVIPPVPARAASGGVTTTTSQLQSSTIETQHSIKSKQQSLNVSESRNNLLIDTSSLSSIPSEYVVIQSEVKSKASNIISKETSFISNPILIQDPSKVLEQQKFPLSTTVSKTTSTISSAGTQLNEKIGFSTIMTSASLNLANKPIDSSPISNQIDIKAANRGGSKSPIDASISKEIYGGVNTCGNSNINATHVNLSTVNRVVRNDKIIRLHSYNENSKVNNSITSTMEKNAHSIGLKLNLPPSTQCISTSKMAYDSENANAIEGIFAHHSGFHKSKKSPKVNENLKITPTEVRHELTLINNTVSEMQSNKIISNEVSSDNSVVVPKNNADNINCATSKDADMRKKRKREYQKQRRQLLSNNKDLALAPTVSCLPVSNSSTSKKRPRKLSKIEEDYDNFIENLMAHIRQMQQLQVLEPLLNRNFGICNTYNRRTLAHMVSTKENEDQVLDMFLLGKYGDAQHPHIVSLYDSKPCRFGQAKEKQNSTIQNNFYDQEFTSVMYKKEYDKLVQLIAITRERNMETIEAISNKNSIGNGHLNALQHIEFPGLLLTNNTKNHLLGRMSPIIPLVGTNSLKISGVVMPLKPSMSDHNMKFISDENYKQQNDLFISRNKERDSNNQTVILSLPLGVADNILAVLKDLANLLHTTPPTTYKVLSTSIRTSAKRCQKHKTDNFKKSQGYINLQNIISGRRKMCRNCGKAIGAYCIRTSNCTIPNLKLNLEFTQKSLTYNYFCCKTCYTQFKFRILNQSIVSLTKEAQKPIVASVVIPSNANVKINLNHVCKTALTLNINTTEEDSKIEEKNKFSKKCGYRYFNNNCFHPVSQFRRISDKEVTNILNKMNITMSASNDMIEGRIAAQPITDTRQCVFCNQRGDALPDGPSRLLNFEVDKWVHLNCALWSNGVYETISGGLMNFPAALHMGLNQACSICMHMGATIKCFKNRCGAVFHLPCAIKEHCIFYKNKTMHCLQHAHRIEKENELTSLAVQRRVFVERDENRQVATVMHHSELSNLLRVGSLTFLNVGQLLPHQLEAFHNVNHIYPIGYKTIRFYWSMKRPYKRCCYVCSIAEVGGRPEFRILVQEHMESDIELRDSSAKQVWQQVLETIAANRQQYDLVQLFPQYISGEDLYGLTEPSIVRIIESLPGIETLTDYRFKYGRNPLLELPLAINPSGAARTEVKQRQVVAYRKPHTQRTGTTNQRMSNPTSSVVAGDVACPYSKQFVHSKSSQYKKMKQEWRNNVYLARSKIQGLGLYASRDMEKHTMIIEYIGEVIRTEVSEIREKQYEAKNRGIYMFRLDENRVVDATLSGGLARYINHSCNPNCVTEIVEVDREVRIIIFAKRRINRGEENRGIYMFRLDEDKVVDATLSGGLARYINHSCQPNCVTEIVEVDREVRIIIFAKRKIKRGEELSYDYKFDIEDDEQKISCMCGASNCQKWMN